MILALCVMYQFATAQCPSNKVWTCRIDSCYQQECKCLFPSQVASWSATVPACKPYHGNPNWGNGFRLSPNDAGLGIGTSFEIYPNPATEYVTLRLNLSEGNEVTLQLYDMMGRTVKITREFLDEGENEITWNVSGIKAGIYFLTMDAAEYNEVKKMYVIN
jgi:hypothetical protein